MQLWCYVSSPNSQFTKNCLMSLNLIRRFGHDEIWILNFCFCFNFLIFSTYYIILLSFQLIKTNFLEVFEQYIFSNFWSVKVWTFWEAHKNLRNLLHALYIYLVTSKPWARFFQILCASQKVRTLWRKLT